MNTQGGLLERLANGPVICAEGYLFEFERRGYLQAGPYVPEIVLEHPEMVAGLHREFVHAGSDVVEAFTYYAHREKLRLIGRENELERINRDALEIAATVARETGTLAAGNLSNTNVFAPDDESTPARALDVRRAGAVDRRRRHGLRRRGDAQLRRGGRARARLDHRSRGCRRSSRSRSTATRTPATGSRPRKRAHGSPTPGPTSSA